jgi:hypothetical protein
MKKKKILILKKKKVSKYKLSINQFNIVNHGMMMKEELEETESPEKIIVINPNYDELTLNSFENLNLEDFKKIDPLAGNSNIGNTLAGNNETHLSSYNSSSQKKQHNNSMKLKIPGVDHLVLDQINDYIMKAQINSNNSQGNLII